MADGSTKPISQVRVGDQISDAVPGDSAQQTHTVQNVITTTTDRDFVDVTVKPWKLGKTLAGVALAAAATLTTTFHHPFCDITQSAFVEAVDLKAGDQVQTTDGGTATVTDVHAYHQQATTYDLTINGLHTYYVGAGATPILVHNEDYPGACSLPPVKGKTQAQTPNHDLLSGWAGEPEGYARVSPEKVLEQTVEMDGPRTPAGFRDHGVDGQYYASHAERQAAMAEPNTPIGVDRPMCDDCIDRFMKLAPDRGVEQRVTDSTGVNAFHSDGRWTVEPQ